MGVQNLSGGTLGQYKLNELLGAGGMGAVYRCYQEGLDRYVAVKVLSALLTADNEYIERFNREAKTSAALEHAHIVPVYDYGTQNGVSYVVMRLLTGGSLAERIAYSKETDRLLPSIPEITTILKQLASALDYAHAKGVIHRDIKTSNVMFDEQGSAFLVDFGIAKLTHATSALTGTGMAMGTPSYMAPEQWRGDPISPAADQYALAVLTYATLTGRLPFEAETPPALMYKHLNEEPTPLSAYRADLPDQARNVLAKALSKEPTERFPNMTQFATALEQAIQDVASEPTGFFVTPLPTKSAARIPAALEHGETSRESIQAGSQPDKKTTLVDSAKFKRGGGSNILLWGGIISIILVAVAGLFVAFGAGSLSDGEKSGTATQEAIIAAILSATDTYTPSSTSTFTESPTPTTTPTATSTATITHTSTTTSTNTYTPTATSSIAILEARRNLTVRAGPGGSYPDIATLAQGDELEIKGISEDGAWYQILLPTGVIGWVVSSITLVDAVGPIGDIAIAQAPTETPSDTPSPTPSLTATLTPSLTNTPSVTPSLTSTLTLTQTSTNTPRPTTTPTRTIVPTDTATPTPEIVSCSGLLPSRLYTGAVGFVTDIDGRPVNVRSAPITAGNDPIDQLQVLEQFAVLDGPECSTRNTWYRVRYAGVLEGWIAEGDNTDYFVAPISRFVDPTETGDLGNVDARLRRVCNIILEDDFADNFSPNDWFTGRGSRSLVEIVDESYQVVLANNPNPSTEPVSWGTLRGVEFGQGNNITIEAIIHATPFSTSMISRMGLWLQYQDENNFLAIMLRSDGSYRVSRFQDTYVDLIGWRFNDAINVGDNVENVIRIDMIGAQFDLFINGQYIERFFDSTWESGRIAFWGSSQDLPATFSMDYFRVCQN